MYATAFCFVPGALQFAALSSLQGVGGDCKCEYLVTCEACLDGKSPYSWGIDFIIVQDTHFPSLER